MKYYIEYPIPIVCDLKCPYCFHRQLWDHNERYPHNQYGDKCAFTLQQFKAWRDKHLADGTEYLVELHGGEMSHLDCQDIVLDIIDNMGGPTKFQLQTNGLGCKSEGFYDRLPYRADKIDRVGFTYHRKMMKGDKVFRANVRLLQEHGIKVYVKELLILEHKAAILNHKKYWEDKGVEFRVQDFKGGGPYPCEADKYTPEDWALIHPEYQHFGPRCACRAGYKQIIIRGYDQHSGDVLACWQDHRVIGHIADGWYEPYKGVNIDPAAPRGRRVDGGRFYRSDYARDLNIMTKEQNYYNSNQRRYWMLARLEAEKERLLGMIRQNEAENAKDRVLINEAQEQARVAVEQAQKRIAERANIIALATGGIQMTDVYIGLAKEPEAKAAEAPEAEAG
jgi:hypothetical protein